MVSVITNDGAYWYAFQCSPGDAQKIPSCIARSGGVYLAPMTLAVAKALQAVGKDMSGKEPIRYDANLAKVAGIHDLMPHQLETAAFMTMNDRCFVLNQQRTGKTGATIAAITHMQRHAGLRGVLIIAPITLLELVWAYELAAAEPTAIIGVLRDAPSKYRVTTFGNRVSKKKISGSRKAISILKSTRHAAANYPQLPVWYLLDPDKMRHSDETLATIQYMMASGEIGMVALDESTVFGNTESQRTKALEEALSKAPASMRRMAMSGTPGGPEKIYTQIKLIAPEKLSNVNIHQWRAKTMVSIPLGGMSYVDKSGSTRQSLAWKPRADWAETITQYLPPTIRYDMSDVFHIDEIVNNIRVDMTAEQQQQYAEVLNDARLSYSNRAGESRKQDIEHMMTETAKLLQISTGTVITEGGVRSMDYSTRLDVLVSLINSTKKKVVVFNTYVATCDRLAADLIELGINTITVTGKVTGKHRTHALASFQQDAKAARVLVCHPSTVQFGVEASAADVIIFNGPVQQGALGYEQAIKRCSSVKQTSKAVMIYRISASPLEEKVWDNLGKSVALEHSLITLIKEGN